MNEEKFNERPTTHKKEPNPVLVDIKNGVFILTGLVLSFQLMTSGSNNSQVKSFDKRYAAFEHSLSKKYTDINPENELRGRKRVSAIKEAEAKVAATKADNSAVGGGSEVTTQDIANMLKERASHIRSEGAVQLKSEGAVQLKQDTAKEKTPSSAPLQASVTPHNEEQKAAERTDERKPLVLGLYPDGTQMSEADKRLQVKAMMTALPMDYTINWIAENEKTSIFVFTDPTCGYCKRLHDSMDEINAAGISVRYIMYARDLPQSNTIKLSPTGENLSNVWCSLDQKAALDDAYNGYRVKEASCADLPAELNRFNPPVGDHYAIGRMLEIQGTPTIVTSDGRVFAGFGGAASLVNRVLNEN